MRGAVGAPASVLRVLGEGRVVPAARAAEVVGDRYQVVHGRQGVRRGAVAGHHDVGRQVEALQGEVDLDRVRVRVRARVGVRVGVRVSVEVKGEGEG